MSPYALAAPLAGWLMSLREVPDPVFAEGMMGEGFAIDPTHGKVVAPCAGTIVQVAPTRHSVTLRTASGAELLIHVGLETVALAGRGFEMHVAEGADISAGDPLITFDMDVVGLQAKSLVTPVVLTNSEEFRLEIASLNRLIETGHRIATLAQRNAGEREPAPVGETARAECVVAFEHGLHARPAARVADAAKRFSGQATIAAHGKSANARSAVAMMALDLQKGDRVTVTVTGADGPAAVDAIAAVLSESAPAPANEIAGVCAVPGIAIGNAFHWRREAPAVPDRGQGADRERLAFEEALAIVGARLRATADELGGPGGEIAEAHIGLLEDEDLQGTAFSEIDKGSSAAHAWTSATAAAAEEIRKTNNSRMQERVADLQDISAQVVRVLTGDVSPLAPKLRPEAILLAEDLLPSELLSLDRASLAGIALERGGATSHMAIIAASLGVPTIVAVGQDLWRIGEGARLMIDGAAGKLVIDPTDELVERVEARAAIADAPSGQCRTRDGEPISLLANLGSVQEVDAAIRAGADGCGLLRTEFLFLDRADAPSVEEQREAYQAIADALDGRPLTIRTLDIGGDKPVPFITFAHEENPALGARGVRTSLTHPELIDEQLRAIAAVQSDRLKVMIPMVSSVDELRSVRERLNGRTIKLGAMVETPAAALIADQLARHADFLSIGTNDLAQYVLAMDRTNALLAPFVDALHPAVLRLIAMTAKAAAGAGTRLSVCGNLAFDPFGAKVLVGLGIRELSGAPALLPSVRQALGEVTIDECRSLAERALQLESPREVRALIEGAKA